MSKGIESPQAPVISAVASSLSVPLNRLFNHQSISGHAFSRLDKREVQTRILSSFVSSEMTFTNTFEWGEAREIHRQH